MGLKRICSQTFRDALISYFPSLNDREEYRRHMRRLIFATDSGNIPISQKHIAFDFRVIRKYQTGTFSAIEYIDDFRNKIFNYSITDWDFATHRCRYASVDFPEEVLQLIQNELMGNFTGPRVLITNGNLVNAKTRSIFRKEDSQEALIINGLKSYHFISDKFLDYLNGLHPHRFSKMTVHIPEAMSAIEAKDSDGNYIINPAAHMTQRLILQCIEEQPQPFYTYTSTGNTVRLFESNKGLQGVHSSLRKIITQDCVEIDIQNAHLAIVAMLWDIPEIQEYLSTGLSIWPTLIIAMGFPYPNLRIKADLKECFYALVYGMSLKKLRENMIRVFGEEAYNRFINHPLIKALLNARNKRMDEIKSKREHLTPWGVVTKPSQYRCKIDKELKGNIPTILSQEVSELEMTLLEPILDLAMETNNFTIVLYQFDGLTLQFKEDSVKNSYLKRIKLLLEERARDLGIITTLTY
jgi:hypothetical protein